MFFPAVVFHFLKTDSTLPSFTLYVVRPTSHSTNITKCEPCVPKWLLRKTRGANFSRKYLCPWPWATVWLWEYFLTLKMTIVYFIKIKRWTFSHILLRSCVLSSASCDRSSRMHLGGTRPSPVNLGNPTFPHSQTVESWDWVQAKCILGRRSVLVHPENWGQSQCLLGI